jgi:hypothetical protein
MTTKIFITALCCLASVAVADTGNEIAAATRKTGEAIESALEDGPYANYTRDGISAAWVCKGKVVRKDIPKSDGATIAPECGYSKPIAIRDEKPNFPAPVKFSAKKIVALSDIHGQFDLMLKLLQQNKVIDRENKWAFGEGHMVIIGDSFDRGPKVTELLWYLYGLEVEARAAGGMVHMLLGNHETMVFYDDLRYVNPKYAAVEKLLGANHTTLFNEQTVLGRWLRSKPMIIQINDMLLLHGGLSPEFVERKMSLAETNEAFRATLGQPRASIRGTSLPAFLYGARGPIWYRGYFNTPKIESAELDAQLAHFGVKRVVVGHTTFKGVYSHYNGRVINTDTDLQKGKSGELFFWEDGKLSRGTLTGERAELKEYAAQN